MFYKILNFGELSTEIQYNVLNYFRNSSDRIVLHSFATKLEELKENEIERLKAEYCEEYCEEYCDDIISFEKEEKEKLELNLKKILEMYLVKYEGDIKECLKSINNKKLDCLTYEMMNKIKYTIFESVFLNEPPFRKYFVRERAAYINYFVLEEDGIHLIDSTCIWYLPNNLEETIYSMKMEVDYSCVVVDEKRDFLEYTYGLMYVETADNFDLIIEVKNNEYFKNRVWTNISDIVKNSNKLEIKLL